MALDKEQREWIATDLTLLSNWQVVDFIENQAHIGFGSRLQQARDLRQWILLRYRLLQSLDQNRAAQLTHDLIFRLDEEIKKLRMAEEESVD